jgi:hypothetical protein
MVNVGGVDLMRIKIIQLNNFMKCGRAITPNGKILAKGGKYSTTDELCRNVAKSANAHSNYRQPAFCQYIVSCRF